MSQSWALEDTRSQESANRLAQLMTLYNQCRGGTGLSVNNGGVSNTFNKRSLDYQPASLSYETMPSSLQSDPISSLSADSFSQLCNALIAPMDKLAVTDDQLLSGDGKCTDADSSQAANLSFLFGSDTAICTRPHINSLQHQSLSSITLQSSSGSAADDQLAWQSPNALNAAKAANQGTLASGGPTTPSPEPTGSLYVKNLPPDADELYLYRKFAVHGALISCKVSTDPTSGKCRGVGFVNFLEHESAVRAMNQLNGLRISEGRQMQISIQAPRSVRAAQQASATVTGQVRHSNTILLPMKDHTARIGGPGNPLAGLGYGIGASLQDVFP